MDTKLLKDLVALAETRSFKRAAELRCITQPTLSRRIQSLEVWAGNQLVDRSTSHATLTPAGQLLRWKALDTIENLELIRATLRRKEAHETKQS